MRNEPLASLRFVNPLPQKAWGAHCSLCDKPQARWILAVGSQTPVFLCGLCILHESAWGKSNNPAVESTTNAIRAASGREFSIVDGRFQRCSEADDVLGVLILVERTAARVPPSRKTP